MLTLLLSLSPLAVAAEGGPPRRAVPPQVLDEVAALEERFERALAIDCAEERCFSTGCTYVDHAVADRPRGGSLPGLGDPGAGPGSMEAQAWLTRARCGYVHEPAADPGDVTVLTRRLQGRVSTGWTTVAVSARALDALPDYFRDPPEDPSEAEEETPELPEEESVAAPLSAEQATRQLWDELLPHLYWMLGIVLLTLVTPIVVWSMRRVGQPSLDERMLLAELEQPGPPPAAPAEAVESTDPWVLEQDGLWRARLAEDAAAPALQALVRQRLKAGDIPLLAKAMLRFPDHFPAAFPSGGDVAAPKLALADFLDALDPDALPDDTAFFVALNRHAAAAALSTQGDAELVRRLRDDFGSAGLSELIHRQSPRTAGLLYALAPAEARSEVRALLNPRTVAEMVRALLESTRMSPAETRHLFAVLEGRAAEAPTSVPDRGALLDAAGAISELLGGLSRASSRALFGHAMRRSNGILPRWTTDIFTPDMLQELPEEARADLLLAVPVDGLAAWLDSLGDEAAADVRAALPASLASAIRALEGSEAGGASVRLVSTGRRALARAFQDQLRRLDRRFEDVLRTESV